MADFDLNKFVDTLKEGFNDLVGQVKDKLGDTSKVSEEKIRLFWHAMIESNEFCKNSYFFVTKIVTCSLSSIYLSIYFLSYLIKIKI